MPIIGPAALSLALIASGFGTPPSEPPASVDALASKVPAEARAAMDRLDPAHDDTHRQALRTALASADRQQRQLAMILLCRAETPPTPALLEACYDGLRDDGIPFDTAKPEAGVLGEYGNATIATEYLIAHPKDAAKLIEKGLKDGDWQRKLLCAFIAGKLARQDLLPLAAPILVKHLADNTIDGDAGTAITALAAFGPAIRPYLSIPAPHTQPDAKSDAQLQTCVRILTRWIDDPDADRFRHWLGSLPEREHDDLLNYTVSIDAEGPQLRWHKPSKDDPAPRPPDAGHPAPPSAPAPPR